MVWAHLGSNQGPTGYEPVALPAELWARQMHVALKYPPAKADLATVDLNRMLIQPEFVKENRHNPICWHQLLSIKLFNILLRLGCRSFLRALASICRIRSRVTLKSLPTSSRVWSAFSPMPNRILSTFSSLGVRVVRTFRVCSAKPKLTTASPGERDVLVLL